MWLSYSLGSKVSITNIGRTDQWIDGKGYSYAMWLESVWSYGNEYTGESYSYGGISSSKGIYIEIDGYFERKLVIKHFNSYPKLKEKTYWGNHFWACGYIVSTIGLD